MPDDDAVCWSRLLRFESCEVKGCHLFHEMDQVSDTRRRVKSLLPETKKNRASKNRA